jgi:hypothetical protein
MPAIVAVKNRYTKPPFPVAPMAGLERIVGQRAAQGERIGHRNVRLCDQFGSAERR